MDTKYNKFDAEYCKDKQPKGKKFEEFFSEYEAGNYRELLEDHIKKEEGYLVNLQAQSQMLDSMLKQASRQLREMRSKKREGDRYE